MHLSEGVLHSTTLITGAVIALAGVAIGLRKLDYRRLSLTALFASAFFVAGTIHVPVGIGSVHLILNGMAGLFLGWTVFPAFLIALLLQVLLFSFGGFSVLGVNLCIMALPALLVHYLFRNLLKRNLSRNYLIFTGICVGTIGVGGAAFLASLVLAFDGGKAYTDLIGLLIVSHLPIFVVDSIVSVGVVLTLTKMMPSALHFD
ncbi:ABC-type Co2+ transport system, permease component [Actinobacillus pleuropneumoniae serovar 3 str. JL03]|uniref:ABC-type Co2+ transport system, permease component n=1 Tax=Actinobacillus pleuropneumoniae serotype 3 (strain JL03) TaxID=434271 RepID=B0BRU8_ACTPJ|nr:cobalt transporter CbiM [Actinobacillus pleuropneumoniae]ABY70207.1 ABC-type Co2+ transport system, permease component [Actinobacillus pleuropneumoniae serovar 3 str. JL03]UKH15126.1 cobalt transporter CbiM [Actinobacillus pleuropneumoniae]UKH44305.1 cobalt transporter CbiM [Actinobacillus pleuropneumoniae]